MRNDLNAVLTWPNGDKYEGGFRDNMIEGQGRYCHASGDKYIGEWKNSQRHGKATYIYQYGGKFYGHFEDDERNGMGIFEWPDGDRYEGSWKHGSRFAWKIDLSAHVTRYGPGKLICKDGRVYQQHWNEPPHSNYAEEMPKKFPEEHL